MALDGSEVRSHLVAKRHGNRLLEIAATHDGGIAIAARKTGKCRGNPCKLSVDDRQTFADLQDRRSVGDVLRRRAPMTVFAQLVTAQRIELRNHAKDRIADALGLLPQLVHVDLTEVAVA